MSKALNEKPNAETLPVVATAGVTLNGRYLPPPEDKDGKIWIRTSALVHADALELYKMWRDVEAAPFWQEQIEKVTRTGETTSHWVMRSRTKDKDKDKDKTIEWDSEISRDESGHRIAWRSIGGESDNAGEVVFEASPGGRGTMVTVLQEFRMGKLASAWETITGRNPKQAVIENLRHFKALAETGEIPRTQGQPHGPRGTIAKVKKSMYGEDTTTPPGLNRKAS
ncbi:MAG: SRPBCC family protein [Candidatus Sulfotelmatobacter sp.]